MAEAEGNFSLFEVKEMRQVFTTSTSNSLATVCIHDTIQRERVCGDTGTSVCHATGRRVASSPVVSRARTALGAVLVLTASVSTTALVLWAPRPAAADQVATLKARAAVISQNLIREQLQVGADQQQYSVDSAKVAADDASMARIAGVVDDDNARIDRDTDVVRRLALAAYMNAGSDLSGSAALFTGDPEDATLTDEYRSISAGDIDGAIDALHEARATLVAEEAALGAVRARDEAEQSQRSSDLTAATGTQRQMESEQAQVTGQLAAAVAAQAAAQAAAAQAAVAAAQRAAAAKITAAAQAAATVGGPGQTSGPAEATDVGDSLSDPALPPYLQCVVQAESGGNYQAVSPNGVYMGAFQFSQPTWDTAASDADLPFLVGVHPNLASKAAQDSVAVALYALDGEQPWLGDRCST